MIVNLLGFLFYILIMIGTYFVARRQWQGWALRFAGNFGWVVLGTYLGLWSVMIFEFVFIVIDARACYTWRRASR